jgi:hypothetical protein
MKSKNLVCVLAKVSTVVVLSLSAPSWAGLATSLMQDATVIKPGTYEMKFQGDIIFNGGGGFEISPHFRMGLDEHLWDVDAYFGVGKIDFVIGGTAKFNLLPDIEGQVGLSFLGGLAYMRDQTVSNALISLGVLVSKEFQADFGTVTPYAALMPEIYLRSNNTSLPTSLALGSRWALDSVKNWNFYSELSFSFYRSNFYLALGAGYPF